MTEKWDTADIASYLDVTRERAQRIVREADFPVPAVNFGRTRRWLRSSVEEWSRAPKDAPAKPEGPTALYRHFDADGMLLYVGVSLAPLARLAGHRRGSHWASSIATIKIQWFENRDEALEAEGEAIIAERPAFNIAGAE